MNAALRSLLRGFRTDDPTEAAHLEAMRQLALAEACTHRDHFVPGHFTASAFVLSPDERRLLLIHHSKLRRWLQPGGHIDPGDPDPVAAARRELAEETGITEARLLEPTPFDLDVHLIPARKADPEHKHYDVRFLFRAPDEHAVAGSDAEDTRWVPLDEVHAIESDASVMRAVTRLRERLTA